MIERKAENKILEMATKYPVLVFTGPRQSGKTTLSKKLFPGYRYVSLENPDNLFFAQNDPNGFLNIYDKYVILDEVQNAPSLFSYLQQRVDEANTSCQYILSGSQNFLLLEKITQSLAGRVYITELLPLSHEELKTIKEQTVYNEIINGSYPRLYTQVIEPMDFYSGYLKTYIERDIRSMLNVHDLGLFRKFILILAHNVGQLFNANTISKEIGVDLKTIQRWYSILETSYIAFSLQPFHQNFSKRIVKTPKIYFYDVGLVSFLLGIENEEELILSTYKGALFENYALLEILKNHKNKGINREYYFWRDSNGNEIDLLIQRGKNVQCIEMKASETVRSEFIKKLHYLENLSNDFKFSFYLLNTQNETQVRTNETILSWKDTCLLD
jgi:predicted AAA+ superfamily ATPase